LASITWGGGDGTSVTITLREGDPNDLKTIGTLADSVSGDFFLWTVSKDLKTASYVGGGYDDGLY
jgi:hypothetical protein